MTPFAQKIFGGGLGVNEKASEHQPSEEQSKLNEARERWQQEGRTPKVHPSRTPR